MDLINSSSQIEGNGARIQNQLFMIQKRLWLTGT